MAIVHVATPLSQLRHSPALVRYNPSLQVLHPVAPVHTLQPKEQRPQLKDPVR